MTTTVARLSGPLTSWGGPARMEQRFTEDEPTYSALVGLLAAAAGISRDEPLPPWILNAPRAVRVDRPGRLLEDFHTVNPLPVDPYRWVRGTGRTGSDDWGPDSVEREQVRAADGKARSGKMRFQPVVTRRFYRADASYLAMFDDPDGQVAQVLAAPRWQLYAGRKACVLSFPFLLATVPDSWEQTLDTFPSPDADGPVRCVCFHEPSQLNTLSSTTRPDGVRSDELGNHQLRRRWITNVEPPATDSWFDLIQEKAR